MIGRKKLSFLHLTPEDPTHPYHVTSGESAEGGIDFWLHSWHHTWIGNRHLVPKTLAREAFRVFFETGQLSPVVEWEDYFA